MKNPTIICFGDSNTWGYDPRGYFGGRYNHPWPEVLAEKLGCTVINLGENGREIPTRPVLFPDRTDLVIIMLGTNDLLQGASVEAVYSRMEHFLASVQEKVLLVAPPPMKPGAWVSDQRLMDDSKALAVHYRALAGTLGIKFADAGSWDISMAHDGVHFTEDGHRAFADGIYQVLTAQ